MTSTHELRIPQTPHSARQTPRLPDPDSGPHLGPTSSGICREEERGEGGQEQGEMPPLRLPSLSPRTSQTAISPVLLDLY